MAKENISMVQRKYIDSCYIKLFSIHGFIKIFIIIALVNFPGKANAIAWLPRKNQYKLTSTILYTDNISQALRKEKTEFLLELYRARNNIYDTNDKLTEYEVELLQELESLCNNLAGFNEDYLISNEIEYGINSKNSIGLKMYFIEESNFRYLWKQNQQPNDHNFYKTKAYNLDAYYKYSVYSNARWQIAIVPEISYYQQNKINKKIQAAIGTYIGYNKISKTGRHSFSEFGISIMQNFNKQDKFKNTNSVKIIFSQGVELKKNIFLTNYSEYIFAKDLLNKSTIYEQIAISTKFMFNKQQDFNIQLGYYWKNNLQHEILSTSGPILSIWLAI